MNKVKKLSGLVLIAAAFAMLPMHPAAFADDSDIFGANIQPKVLILLDNSGSMSEVIGSYPYTVSNTYSVINKCGSSKDTACSTPVVYKAGSSGTYTMYKDTVANVSKAAARNALNSVGYWSGSISGSNVDLYTGNYLNYQLGFCTGVDCNGEAKIDIAKRVLKNLVDNVTGVRFGFMKFWNNDVSGATCNSSGHCGASMVAQMGTTPSVMKAAVDAISPFGYTPLGEMMKDAGLYYEGKQLKNGNTYTTPIQSTVGQCQPNFIILISDGLQNGYLDVQQEAGYQFANDHSTVFTGKQNVIVHSVGFALDAADKAAGANDILKNAAKNGGGLYFEAENSAQLEQALQKQIQSILAATFTFATPVVPTTSTTGSTKAYLAAFQSDQSSPFWHGFLKAYQRDSNGLVPIYTSGINIGKPINAPVWEAGGVLNGVGPGARVIKTVTSVSTSPSGTSTIGTGSLSSFDKGNAALTYTKLAVANTTERDQLIDFLRGIDVMDEDNDTNITEDRPWKLGDIFHSTPVLVTPPVLALNDSSYTAFKSAPASRTKVLITGANDGMLHAFRESDGAELWAFIPPDLLDNLKTLTDTGGDHQFYVDSSPIATDIKVGSTWKTIVVFGMRRGGAFYYALDIADTTNPLWMWSFTDSKIAETWSEPSIGKVKISGSDKYVAFFGGGYDTASNNSHGKAFFAVDLSNGTKLWEYYKDGTADDRQYMNFSLAENSTAVDLNNDGYVDRVYIGDVGGQLWKFDVSASATSSWAGKRLFTAAPSQANPPASGEFYPAQGFYGAPALAYDTAMNLWVFLGTGDRNHPNGTASNRFYGIKETTNMSNSAALTESNLANVTSTNGTASGGWFFQLGTNEKVLDPANVFNMDVLFSGFTPTSTVTCTSGGGT